MYTSLICRDTCVQHFIPSPYLTEPIKDVVEEHKHRPSGYLRDIVEGLTGVVTHPGIRILETGQYWFHQLRQTDTNGALQGLS